MGLSRASGIGAFFWLWFYQLFSENVYEHDKYYYHVNKVKRLKKIPRSLIKNYFDLLAVCSLKDFSEVIAQKIPRSSEKANVGRVLLVPQKH